LPQNTGSQSFPNNQGVHASWGSWIAYIGHDDIWAPDNLESMARMIAADDKLDFVVGGCAYHGPEGSERAASPDCSPRRTRRSSTSFRRHRSRTGAM